MREKMDTRACVFFAHRERARVGLARLLQVQIFCPHSHGLGIGLAYANLLPQVTLHVCKSHANRYGTVIAYTHANLLPQNKTGIELACVSVGMRLARPCKDHAILAWVSVNLLPRLLGMTIAWLLVNLLPGETGPPMHTRMHGQKNDKQNADTSKPPAHRAGGSGGSPRRP